MLGEDLKKILPIINREGSDSAILDNVLEFLTMNGRPLDRAVTMMIPEPWDNNDRIDEKRRAYDAYQSMLMEPWDGPAAIAFTDGRMLGAALDRNGLRPARYYVTRKDWLILSSEVGTIDVDPEDILQAGCLGPGEMLEVDPDQGRVIWNDEIRNRYANEKPYRDWLGEEMLSVDDLPLPEAAPAAEEDAGVSFTRRMAKLGYHFDDIQELIRPMANKGSIPLASMGTDAPLACLSKKTRSFFDYFNQLFAQVTNPPIDALRESFVTSTVLYVGNHGNLLEDCRDTCRLVRLEGPMLTHDEFDRLCSIDRVGFKTARFSCTYPRSAAEGALEGTLASLRENVGGGRARRREPDRAVRSRGRGGSPHPESSFARRGAQPPDQRGPAHRRRFARGDRRRDARARFRLLGGLFRFGYLSVHGARVHPRSVRAR